MDTALFYVFAAFTLGCGFLVVANPWSRNPVTSAMFLVLTIVGLAGLFVLLHAFFLAAVQILIYAGAVMVLFLFVIMLLDLKAEARRQLRWFTTGLGVLGVLGVAWLMLRPVGGAVAQPLASGAGEGNTGALGRLLFAEYLLPFEVVSLILLVAMVGVVWLSRKEPKA